MSVDPGTNGANNKGDTQRILEALIELQSGTRASLVRGRLQALLSDAIEAQVASEFIMILLEAYPDAEVPLMKKIIMYPETLDQSYRRSLVHGFHERGLKRHGIVVAPAPG